MIDVVVAVVITIVVSAKNLDICFQFVILVLGKNAQHTSSLCCMQQRSHIELIH